MYMEDAQTTPPATLAAESPQPLVRNDTIPTEKNKRRTYVLIIIFVFLFLVSALSLGMLIYKKGQDNTLFAPKTAPTSIPTPTTNPTADWIEFVAEGFSIKHPADWVLAQSDKSEDLYMYFSKTAPADPTNNIVTLLVQNIDIERATNNLNKGDAGLQNSAEFTYDTLNGVKIVKAVSTFSQMDPKTSTYISEPSDYVILIPLGDKTIMLSSLLKNKDTLDQILSTLKFTNYSQESRLNTYNGEHVTFSYPSIWNLEKNVPCCGVLPYDDIKLGIPGATGDQTLGFSSPDFSELNYSKALETQEITIGGKKGTKVIQELEIEGSNQKFSYSYCTSGYKNDGSFCVNVSSSKLDKNLERSLDSLVTTITFK